MDSVTDALNLARTRLNDRVETLEAVSGNILDKPQAFSQQATNGGWRKLNRFLANGGFSLLKQEALILAAPVVASTDPAIQVRLDGTGYFDGATQTSTPALPADLMVPLKLWERRNGQNAPFPKDPMELFVDGLPSWPKRLWNYAWEWRAGAIYLPGAQQIVDFRLLYSRYLGDFVEVTANPGVNQVVGDWFDQPVPITDCLDALADYICREICISKGDSDGAKMFQASAESNATLILNRDAAMKQRGNIRRQSRSGRLEGRGYSW